MRAAGVGILVGLNIIEECHNCHICLEWGSHLKSGPIWYLHNFKVIHCWISSASTSSPLSGYMMVHDENAIGAIQRNSRNSTQLTQLSATQCNSHNATHVIQRNSRNSIQQHAPVVCNLSNLQTQNLCTLQANQDLLQMYFKSRSLGTLRYSKVQQ